MRYYKKNSQYLTRMATLQQEFKQQLLESRLETQEETMAVLSKELHDNIGQLLNSTKLLIGISQRNPDNGQEILHIAESTVGKAIQEIRSLSKSLSKEWLQQFNLLENLEAEIARINSSGILQIHLKHKGTVTIEADKQIILFRIIQEALQNAIKHAQASTIDIEIESLPGVFLISIKDNGIGLSSKNEAGLGISNIKHRAGLLGGEASWQSGEQPGTNVVIRVPV